MPKKNLLQLPVSRGAAYHFFTHKEFNVVFVTSDTQQYIWMPA